jgi:AraC family transcriptional regulator
MRIFSAMNYIHDHLAEELTLDEVASEAHFSKYHFHRIFNAMVGETVGAFIRRLRMERAAENLMYSLSSDVSTIAHKYGFSSSQNFTRAFKSHFGMTPTEFRKENMQAQLPIRDVSFREFASFPWEEHDAHEFSKFVKVKILPSRHVAYSRRFGRYDHNSCFQAFQTILEFARANNLDYETEIGICWDNLDITDATRCRYDACIEVPEGTPVSRGIALQTIPEGLHAVAELDIENNDFAGAWRDFLGGWMPTSGLEPKDKPRYEITLDSSNQEEGKWKVQLCCPVQPI